MNLDMVIRFGKWKGKTVRWVMSNDRRYFNWAQENVPDMFKDPRSAAVRPSSLDLPPREKETNVDPPAESDETGRAWTNPRIFYEIAQKYLKEWGMD